MNNTKRIPKELAQILTLSFFLIVQFFILTKLVQYDKIEGDIGVRDEGKIDVSQPHIDGATSLLPDDKVDFVLGDLNRNGDIDDEDFQLIQEYAKHPENLPEDLYDIANVNEDDSFDVRDVSAFRRKYIIGE